MLGMGVEEIRRLSQDEGYRDNEIAVVLGIHRVTVARIRGKYSIPRVNLKNRKDKVCSCVSCGSAFIIRRGEVSRKCSQCKSL